MAGHHRGVELPRQPPLNRPKLLFVEDDHGDRELLSVKLQHAFRLVTVGTLAEAITWLDAEEFDCVLLDLGLPDSHYGATLNALLARYPAALVIVMSGNDDPVIQADSIAGGAVGYLVKGRDDQNRETLEHVIASAIARRKTKLP